VALPGGSRRPDDGLDSVAGSAGGSVGRFASSWPGSTRTTLETVIETFPRFPLGAASRAGYSPPRSGLLFMLSQNIDAVKNLLGFKSQ
jgi:hypothetical protein